MPLFLRAEIIRPEETLMASQNGLKRISEENRKAFERHEREFQDYQSCPGLGKTITEPAKVLDAQ